MAGSFKVGMTLTAKDEASLVLVKGLKLTTKTAADAEKAVTKVSEAQQKASEEAIRATRAADRESRRASEARARLGVRSEQTIQREIARTIASYNRLTRASVMSSQEQERAYDATISRVRALQREMGTLARETVKAGAAARTPAGGSGGGFLQGATAVAGGVAAAGAVMAKPVMNKMDYDSTLAYMSNTAFSEGGIKGRLQGRKTLDATIRKAVSYGGGTKEAAADALNALLGSGAVSAESAGKLLPQIMKYSTATGTSPADLVGIAVAGKRNFGMKDADIPTAFNMAIMAGKSGSFELKDMAGFLAPQMALASQSAGMKGLGDFSKLLALNEASATAAGSSSEAGNNVMNLLAKLNSPDSIATARHIKYNGHGIDLPGTLAAAREQGVDPIEAFSRLVDKVAGSNPQYQALQKRLAGAKSDADKSAILGSMSTILEGSSVGKMVPDRQAILALLAYRNTPQYRKEIEAKINAQKSLPDGQREGDYDYTSILDTDKNRVQQAQNAHDFAQMDSVQKQAHLVGSIAEGLSKLETDFPELARTVEGANTAIQAMTAAAVAFAGIKFLTGAGAGAGAGAAAGASGAAEAAVGAVTKGGGLFGALGRLLGIGGTATALATFTTEEEDEASNGSDARWKAIRAKYPQSVIDAARKKYQPWYQFGEGYSTENERWIQQYLADPQNGAGNAFPSPGQVPVPGAAGMPSGKTPAGQGSPSYLTAAPSAFAPINITTQLTVDGQVLAEVVNHHNVMDGNRSTGGTTP